MKTRQLTLTLVCAAVMTALAATPALAQETTTSGSGTTSTSVQQESTRLSSQFSTFAGSDTNAQALVNGLRDGTSITLAQVTQNADGTTTTTDTTIQPVTGTMGYGNVRIALSLAEASLAKAGITDPTPAEIAAALNGGSVTLADGTTVDLAGVLAARASGEGWGQIANAMGFKLGDVMRSPKVAGHAAAGAHANVTVAKVEFGKDHMINHPDVGSHMGRPDFANKPDFAGKPSLPERPQIPDHPTHIGRPGG